MYVVQVLITRNLTLQSDKEDGSLNVSVTLKMRNPHGYLSAVDYPALVVRLLDLSYCVAESFQGRKCE